MHTASVLAVEGCPAVVVPQQHRAGNQTGALHQPFQDTAALPASWHAAGSVHRGPCCAEKVTGLLFNIIGTGVSQPV